MALIIPTCLKAQITASAIFVQRGKKARERQTFVCWENKEQSYSASRAGCWKDNTEINEEVPWNVTQRDHPHGAALGDQKPPALSE